MWSLLIVILSTAIVGHASEIGSYDYDNKIEETTSVGDRDNLTSNVYVLPDQIFNDGKPFFVKKDASGTIDFNAKTTPETLPVPTDAIVSIQSTAATALASSASTILNSTRKHDISLDNTVRAQNIHDYLNLPVKYQSSKFVYPLMSSSYANLKYQGNNKNFISNHKFDSSTVKSVPYTTKKYRPTYSTKSYALSKQSSTESYDSSTKATPLANRKYSSIPPRSSTPNRRFSTVNRLSSTTPRTETKFPHRMRSTTTTTTSTTSTTTSTEKSNDFVSDNNGLTTVPAIASDWGEEEEEEEAYVVRSTTIAPNRSKNATETNSEPAESMNFGDLFSYFFNNEENNEDTATRTPTKATPLSTVTPLRPAISTTRASIVSKVKDGEHIKPHRSDPITRRPYHNRTTVSRSTTVRPTTSAAIVAPTTSQQITKINKLHADRATANTGNFRPPAVMESIHVSSGAQTASFVTNGHVATNNNNHGNAHYSDSLGQFQPPNQNDMKNIVVLPESNSASFVATSQLQTTTRFDQTPPQSQLQTATERKPVTKPNTIDETTKPGIQFFSKGHVTSAEAYDHPTQSNVQNVVFSGPSASNSNSNNVVIAPGTHTASFVTKSQMSMGNNQQQSSSPHDQKINSVENGISSYELGVQAQRPHGFQLPSTTAIPKTISAAASNNEAQTHQIVRFPIENGENGEKSSATHDNPPESAPLISTNNTIIKFPSSSNLPIVPANSQLAAAAAAAAIQSSSTVEGLVKFTDVRNEITDGIDPNSFKQTILQAPNSNYVVFRPQSPPTIAMVPQAPLVMGMTVPQLYRNPAFIFKKPNIIQTNYYPRKNYTNALPNILPQFRPTQAQQMLPPQIALSQSPLHRGQYLYTPQSLRYKSPMQIVFNQRPMQIRPALEQTQNRRHFDLHPGNMNRIYHERLPHILNNRNVIGANALLMSEPQRFDAVTNGAVEVDAIKNPDFENSDAKLLQEQQQLQPIVNESRKENETPQVEPVRTLQRLRLMQQKTGANGLSVVNRNATNGIAAVAVPDAVNSPTEKPLYVVYPMQKNPAIATNRGNGEISTILAEQMQHKPAPLQQQQRGPAYSLEKHKSRYILNSRPAYDFEKKSDQLEPIAAENDEDDGDRPIAIAYSPTEPSPPHLADVYRPTPAHQVSHAPVHRNTASEDVENSGNQQFQAPFIPSINLDLQLKSENTQQSTHNGWSIVTPPSVPVSSKIEPKINRISASLANANVTSISRSDSGETVAASEEVAGEFKVPEFITGFMPIYKTAIAPSPLPSASSSSSSSSSSSAESVPIPSQKSEMEKTQSEEKSTDRSDNFSLASLLYGDDDDDDDNDNDDGTDDANDE